ncbi:MAG: reverse transcriptase/maturase family protein [Patescibacteria group bacterium]
MKIQLTHKFEDIISVENLLSAWQEFIKGKRNRRDVQIFSIDLMDNILQLHQDLASKTYQHGDYYAFHINDPKPRHIHKASVRDRLLHHAIYRILYPFFDRTFISDSFSCRVNKGTHKAINRFRSFAYQVNKNNTKTCWILKCEIRKFFENIDHEIILKILSGYISDSDIIWLLKMVISSFSKKPNCGLPLGNLTSQLFVNIYMNKFDQFVKHKLKIQHYIRYADDFVILSRVKESLEDLIPKIGDFLKRELRLSLHPQKVFIKTLASGVDYLGWVHFPDHRVLRTATKRKMMRRLAKNPKNETKQSYLGLLKHGNTEKIRQKLIATFSRFS